MLPAQDLILLGLLMERPLHGYEIKQLIEQRMADLAKVSPGTIYYTLKKLQKRHLIESTSERSGNRPERRVYSLTDTGRKTFRELLKRSLNLDDHPYSLFDLGLYFFEHLDDVDLEQAIHNKLRAIDKFKRRIAAIEHENPGHWPFQFEALRRKGRLLTEAFEHWYLYLQDSLQKHRAEQGREQLSSDEGVAREQV